MKKYLYAGILLGAVVLAGCSVNEESEGRVNEEMTEGLTDGQTVEVESLSDTDKEEVVLEALLQLPQEEREAYYKQYVEIVEEVNAEHSNADLEVVPLNEFAEEDWVEPEKFRQLAIERANLEFTSKVFGGDPVE